MAGKAKLEALLVKGATYGMKLEAGYKTYEKGVWYPITTEQEYKLMAASDAFQIREVGKGGNPNPDWQEPEGGEGEEAAGEESGEESGEDAGDDKPKKKRRK